MEQTVFDGLRAQIAEVPVIRRVGRLAEIGRGTLRVTGLGRAALGDRVTILGERDQRIGGEILRLSREGATILPDGGSEGLAIGDPVELLGRSGIAPDGWVASSGLSASG